MLSDSFESTHFTYTNSCGVLGGFLYSFYLPNILQLGGKLLVFSCGELPLINNLQFLNKKSYFSWKMSAKDLMNFSVHTDCENSSDRCYT